MPRDWAEICKFAHETAHNRESVAVFATNWAAFALAQSPELRHLKGAFQASSPKLSKPGPVPGFFSPDANLWQRSVTVWLP
jgi:hypothetical protein